MDELIIFKEKSALDWLEDTKPIGKFFYYKIIINYIKVKS